MWGQGWSGGWVSSVGWLNNNLVTLLVRSFVGLQLAFLLVWWLIGRWLVNWLGLVGWYDL